MSARGRVAPKPSDRAPQGAFCGNVLTQGAQGRSRMQQGARGRGHAPAECNRLRQPLRWHVAGIEHPVRRQQAPDGGKQQLSARVGRTRAFDEQQQLRRLRLTAQVVEQAGARRRGACARRFGTGWRGHGVRLYIRYRAGRRRCSPHRSRRDVLRRHGRGRATSHVSRNADQVEQSRPSRGIEAKRRAHGVSNGCRSDQNASWHWSTALANARTLDWIVSLSAGTSAA